MDYTRRQFLGAIGAGTVASAGLAQPVTAQETPVVEMGNNYFDPIGLYVEPGTTVRFEIAAGVHSATAYSERIPADATAFDSTTISQGSFEHTFETPGTYDYYCLPHKSVGMVGRIVVGAPGGPAEGSPIPDGEVPGSETIVERGSVSYKAFTGDDEDTDGGMMGHGMGPGMMDRRTGGWTRVLPLFGGALGTLGLIGAGLYWMFRQGDDDTGTGDTAIETLQARYANGEIDEDEYRRRKRRLERDQ